MAPRWPQVNTGPEHINEHATYLREACIQLQAADRGRTNQIPWHVFQAYVESTLALIGKVLQQPSVGEVLHQIRDAAKDIQTIQRDVTAVKSSIGLGTTLLNLAKFSGVKTAQTTWAQVAAQAKSSTLPPPPVPVRPGSHTTKNPTTVTAYRDRLVTVKLKDHGIVQRYRSHPVAWTEQQVQNSIRDNNGTRSVRLVAAHQLKSGDLQIFASTSAEVQQLKQNKGWLKGLGEHAEVVVPTYGVIVHGISTSSINIKDQKTTIQHILADNYTVIPDAKISYVGWLTREGPLKRASSIVVEFAAPEMANAVIHAGMAWEGQIHQCQLYDRTCRVKQCFRCNHYDHIGAQCNAFQTCGYCAEAHEAKHCRQKRVEGFTPRCAVCKGAHTAWSNACPARKKELERVEQAKQNRSIYWDVPARNFETHPRMDNARHSTTAQETNSSRDSAPNHTTATQTTTQVLEQTIRTAVIPADREPPSPSGPRTNHLIETTQEALQTSTEETTTEAPPGHEEREILAPNAQEDWATPATQQDGTPQASASVIDPRLGATEESFPHGQVPEDNQAQQSVYPLDGIEGNLTMPETDTWLDEIFNDEENTWMPDTVQDESSPATSVANEPHSATRKIFKGYHRHYACI
ncbi:uncharacterized protein PV06_11675 [Exophiala oligosperma]|uniref:CCHC-type domain-containing protein n=1 Tax=Exophiala oligosperma TaxID=215243 RepID=A0A0D2D1G2_9EURO|nr:uncharacterized protein PV06_11675 [Exophiala oligosperma]KIW36020.1 hypothetical protein PV06_11675 [Exophiala oligosperma]